MLAWLGYILLGLLALVVLLVGLVLLAPVSFRGQASVSAISVDDQAGPSGLLYLAALDPDLESLDPEAVSDETAIEFDAAVRGEVRVLWGLLTVSEAGVWLLGFRLGRGRQAAAPTRQSPAPAAPRVTAPTPPPAAAPARRPAKARRVRGRVSVGDLRRLWPEVRRSLARSWRALHLRLRADLAVGLEDPAMTGLLAAALPAILGSLLGRADSYSPGSVSYRLTPVFDREVLEAEVELSGRTSLAGMTWPWIRLALRREVRALWWPRRSRPGPVSG